MNLTDAADDKCCCNCIHNPEDLEVIGNIYDDPELSEVEKCLK